MNIVSFFGWIWILTEGSHDLLRATGFSGGLTKTLSHSSAHWLLTGMSVSCVMTEGNESQHFVFNFHFPHDKRLTNSWICKQWWTCTCLRMYPNVPSFCCIEAYGICFFPIHYCWGIYHFYCVYRCWMHVCVCMYVCFLHDCICASHFLDICFSSTLLYVFVKTPSSQKHNLFVCVVKGFATFISGNITRVPFLYFATKWKGYPEIWSGGGL